MNEMNLYFSVSSEKGIALTLCLHGDAFEITPLSSCVGDSVPVFVHQQ